MNKSFWDRIHDLQESINGGVEPLEQVKLKTSTLKTFLGLYLIQSVIIAFTLSIMYSSLSAWIIPMSSLLQVGWLWNKVTDYWKFAHGFRYTKLATNEDDYSENVSDIMPRETTSASTHPLQQDLWETAATSV